MVYTRDVIVFANVGQEVVLDVIPLSEVVSVKPVGQGLDMARTFNTMLFLMISCAIVSALTILLWNVKLVLPWLHWSSSSSQNSALDNVLTHQMT
jgi:hypothetical protein